MKMPSESTLVIAGIVRNAASRLRRNIEAINRVRARFKDSWVVIFENDSTDGTKEILQQWHEAFPERVVCITEEMNAGKTIPSYGTVNGNPFFSWNRISKMAFYRNKYMEYIEAHGIVGDYLMVVDLDVQKIFPESVFSCFLQSMEWDAVTAFGYSLSPHLKRRYHDTYIFQDWDMRGKPQTESYMQRVSRKYASLKVGDPWIRVAAAFGGLAIYRFDAVRGLRYQVLPNDDENVTVYGEHYSIYQQMMDRGFDRFFLNPSMYLKYQRVTPRIIVNSLQRMLRRK